MTDNQQPSPELHDPQWLNELHSDLNAPRERGHLLLAFFINDYRSQWNALSKVSVEEMSGRSNFVFAKESMRLLELICRSIRTSRESLDAYSAALKNRNPAYFIHLPAFQSYKPQGITTVSKGTFSEVHLPRCPSGKPILLWLLFDLLRNGIAHDGLQNTLVVNNERIYLGISGTPHMGSLAVHDGERRLRNLRYLKAEKQIIVFPEALFLDFAWALKASNVHNSHKFQLDYPERVATCDPEELGLFMKDLENLAL